MPKPRRTLKRPLVFWLGMAAVIAAGLMRLRVWQVLDEDARLFPDSVSYLAMSEGFPSEYLSGHPWSFKRPPGYPAFLAMFDEVGPMMLGQVGIAVLGVVLVWRWAASAISESAGMIAALARECRYEL